MASYTPGQPPVQATVVGEPLSGVNPSGRVVQGVPYRCDPANASPENMPWLGKFSEKRVGRKVEEVRKGGELAAKFEFFPETRKCQDAVWILALFAVLGICIGINFQYGNSPAFQNLQPTSATHQIPSVVEMVQTGIVGGIVSLVMAFVYVSMANKCPGCVVWTSLIFGPALSIAMGLAMIAIGLNGQTILIIMGLLFIGIGCLSLFCVFYCWRHLIPFMITLVETVATVIKKNTGMILVSVLGSILGIAWSLIVGLAIFLVYLENKEEYKDVHQGAQYAIYFVCTLIFIWGGLVAYNFCHVTYCGVFGRWYFKKDTGSQLRESLRVAGVTSFGSICLGSFLIAVIRAMESTVRSMRRDAQGDGNAVACVLLCILECMISCIGDIMEYFSEWAFVQVACRGVSFCQAVRITYSMCSCANIVYIVQDLLLDSVVNLGALLCGMAGALGGGAAGYGMAGFESGGEMMVIVGLVIGLFAGLVAGGSAIGIFSSGVKTILSCWAERPESLQETHPHIHAEFENKIMRNF